MKEKDYTSALVGTKPQKRRRGLLAALAPRSDEALFYEAIRKDQGIHLMWIEYERLGNMCTYPCLYETDEETLVFLQGHEPAVKENNQKLMARWNAAIDPERLKEEYTLLTPSADDFYALFKDYRRRAAGAAAEAEPEAETAEETAEPEEE